MTDRRTENLLGTLSLAVADRMRDGLTGAAEAADTDATALSALDQFLDGATIDLLRQVLGLTSSGTVRLVDRLEAAGYVRRGRLGGDGADRRATTVTLTAAGREAAGKVTGARRAVLRDALAVLSPAERERFGELAGRMVAAMVRPAGATRWMCRLCDLDACGRPRGECPVAVATGYRPREDPADRPG
ncbi:MAG: MarR family winged helix-turn-helix transcriptional regulator [Mycobacteriales bacterium]